MVGASSGFDVLAASLVRTVWLLISQDRRTGMGEADFKIVQVCTLVACSSLRSWSG